MIKLNWCRKIEFNPAQEEYKETGGIRKVKRVSHCGTASTNKYHKNLALTFVCSKAGQSQPKKRAFFKEPILGLAPPPQTMNM
ncbi:hypothetical protein [Neomoorella thermoacetica]|uniref:hypothetical protein n=1 Tax=Neomoorella thermoacetica TaxID=1525 RepID=UPI0011E71889|nr:hypothetical protein [Moorella thermoacetica]